jgi:hypothetical protein
LRQQLEQRNREQRSRDSRRDVFLVQWRARRRERFGFGLRWEQLRQRFPWKLRRGIGQRCRIGRWCRFGFAHVSARVSFRGILTNSEELDRSAASSPSRASTR